MTSRFPRVRITYEIIFSVAIFIAIVIQYSYGLFHKTESVFNYTEQFFSYFTILSNMFVAVVFAIDASLLLRRKVYSFRFDSIRGAAVFCIITTGLTYSLFLHGPGSHGQVPYSIGWVNEIFHHIVPLVAALDWLFFPPKNRMNWSTLFAWIGLTMIYAVLVELAGTMTHTYPYFFLNPELFRGYAGIFRASAGFLPFFLVFSLLVIGSTNSQRRIKQWLTTRSSV
jgi:hypothetical protein